MGKGRRHCRPALDVHRRRRRPARGSPAESLDCWRSPARRRCSAPPRRSAESSCWAVSA